MPTPTLLFASQNKKKAEEIRAILGNAFQIRTLGEMGFEQNLEEPFASFFTIDTDRVIHRAFNQVGRIRIRIGRKVNGFPVPKQLPKFLCNKWGKGCHQPEEGVQDLPLIATHGL